MTLLWTRIAGAHLHYCFDGAEPPAQVHVLDMGVHEEAPCETSGKAINSDVDEDKSFSAKLCKPQPKLLALPAPAFPAAATAAERDTIPLDASPTAIPGRICLRPPLRGPPQFSSLSA